jgi:hypothetical protein
MQVGRKVCSRWAAHKAVWHIVATEQEGYWEI